MPIHTGAFKLDSNAGILGWCICMLFLLLVERIHVISIVSSESHYLLYTFLQMCANTNRIKIAYAYSFQCSLNFVNRMVDQLKDIHTNQE